MEPFLKEAIRNIVVENKGDLSGVTLVFNNRRPSLFAKKYVHEICGDNFFMPKSIVFDDLVSDLGNVEILPNEFLLFELFFIHQKINPQDHRTLEQFIPMADMMLADFSEIDRYMVDVKDIYGNLHDLKEIGEWRIDGSELTAAQKEYLRFYKSIFNYYSELNTLLDSRNQAYYGMAYRKVAENIDSILDNREAERLYFLGFNALSKCEEAIIKAYIARGRAHYIPDGDKFYVDSPSHEAGLFIRRNLAISSVTSFDEHFKEGSKNIFLVKTPDNISQAKYASTVLEQIAGQPSDSKSISIDETALVLADEGLIYPVLNSLPDAVSTANVTMGIPFSTTDTHSLVLSVISLYADIRDSRNLFYHKDLTDLLTNPYVCGLLEQKKVPEKVIRELTKKKAIYTSLANIRDLFSAFEYNFEPIAFLFSADYTAPFDMLNTIRQLAQTLLSKEIIPQESKEQAALECLIQIIDYLESIRQHIETAEQPISNPIDNIQNLKKIYLRIAQRRNVSLKGDPKVGLQILGVLETRNLDFRRIILLSASEGIIPSSRSVNTLIPNSLKHAFEMPTYYEKDAVYAYNFYHLLQRAEEIYIVSENNTKACESRFVQQLRAELAKKYSNIHIQELSVSNSNIELHDNIVDHIDKNDDIISLLRDKPLSPSSINTYRDCPFRFFYESLLYVRKEDEISDTIEKNELGSIIHECLKDIYSQFKQAPVDKSRLEEEVKTVPDHIESLIKKSFVNGDLHEGKNDLLRSVAITQVVRFLKKEISIIEQKHTIEIIQLEEKMQQPVSVEVDGKPCNLKFNVTADRIDRIDGVLRVIDYKSGKVVDSDLKWKTNDQKTWRDMKDKWFQVMFYSWYYARTHKVNENMMSGIMPLQNLRSDFMPASVDDSVIITPAVIDSFEKTLSLIFSEMFDKTIPFVMKDDKKNCDYCTIASVCKKLPSSASKNAAAD